TARGEVLGTKQQRRWSPVPTAPGEVVGRGTTGAAGSLVGGLLAVAGLEAGHTATGVEDLLLARVERVARAAHVGPDLAGRLGGAGLERVATGAHDRGGHVLRVDVLLHGISLGFCIRVERGRAPVNRMPARN